MKQSKICITRSYSKYYSVKLNVKKANVLVKQLVKYLEEIYKQLQQKDSTMVIYAYDDQNPSDTILKPYNIQSDIRILKISSIISASMVVIHGSKYGLDMMTL